MDCANILRIFITFKANALKAEDNLKKLIFLDNTLKEEFKVEDDNSYEEIKICDDLFPKVEQTEEDLYVCNICHKQYTHHKRYLNHLLTHETERTEVKIENDFDINGIVNETEFSDKYECEECDKTFTKERALISHKRKHKSCTKDAKTDKFECDYCHKMFSMKPLLKRHLKLHSTNRPFPCAQCSKSYTRQDQLMEHLKKHDKVKAHVCSYCNKGYKFI